MRRRLALGLLSILLLCTSTAGGTTIAVLLQTDSAIGIAADNDGPFDFIGTDSFSVVGVSDFDSDMDMLAAGLGVATPFAGARADEEEPLAIKEGRTVSIEYTIKLDDGSTAVTNVGQAPLVYQQGAQQALHAFEREIAGMKVNETREFVLSPEEGYGPVNPELRQEVRADRVPEEARREGAQFVSKDRAGNNRRVRVHEVRGDTIVLDLNHRLAGQNLHFQVKVVGIE